MGIDEILGLTPEDGKELSEFGEFGGLNVRVQKENRQSVGRPEDEDGDEDESSVDADEQRESSGVDEDASPRGDEIQELEVEDEDEGEDEDAEHEKHLKSIQENPDLQKANAALLQEVRRLRAENKLARMRQPLAQQTAQQQAPEPRETTQQPLSRLRVELDETGTEAFIPAEKVIPLVQQAIEQAQRPSPLQAKAIAIQQVTQNFIQQDPSHMEVVRRANEVDDYLSQVLQSLRGKGYHFETIDDAIEAVRAEGVEERVVAAYPELDGFFDDFVRNMASGDPNARTLVYRTLKLQGQLRSAQPARRRSNSTNGAKRPLGKQPASLGRKAGARASSSVKASDQREFDQLEAEFQANVAGFPDAKYRRLQALAKQIGIEGY